MSGDAGTIADCGRRKVRFCIAGSGAGPAPRSRWPEWSDSLHKVPVAKRQKRNCGYGTKFSAHNRSIWTGLGPCWSCRTEWRRGGGCVALRSGMATHRAARCAALRS